MAAPVGARLGGVLLASLLGHGVGAAEPTWLHCPPIELCQLRASDGGFIEHFGWAVAIEGTIAAIGEPFARLYGCGNTVGAVYVQGYDGTQWVEQQKLVASDGTCDSHLGYSVAMSGDLIVAGAPHVADYTGAAYVFRFDGQTWVEEAKLVPPEGAVNTGAGMAVALEGNTIAVSAPGAGAVYVYSLDGSTWLWQATLVGENGMGGSVALSGSVLAGSGAGGPEDPTSVVSVFRYDGAAWCLEAELTPADGAPGDGFGVLAVCGDTILVGSPYHDHGGVNAGAAYVFTFDGQSWSQQAELIASDAHGSDYFGCSVALADGTAVIGAYGWTGPAAWSGKTYVLTVDDLDWIERAILTASDGRTSGWFGFAVAMSGDTVLIGAPCAVGNADQSGKAYAFAGLTSDCNANGIPDLYDIAACTSPDCNANTVPDECDLASGTSADADNSGLPDECEVGDLDCDGDVDLGDINPFVMVLSDPVGWQAEYPDCYILRADVNQDGTVNFGDINPFVALLTGGP
jgi:hypothetical protein